MGNYNPRAPYILGEEWVPIRDEDTIFSPAVNSLEVGHHFTTTASRTLATARFYINELHVSSDRGQTFMSAIYPIGTEDQSGPISSVIIPVNAVVGTNATASGAPTLADALLTQSSASGVVLNTASADAGIAMSFAVSGALVLTGKRILGVNLLSGTAATADITGPLRDVNTSQIVVGTNTTINSGADPQAIFGRLRLEREIDRTPFGEINQFWTANSPNLIADRVPWTYAQLTRMDAVATRLYTKIETGTNRGTTANSSCYIFYAALEVIYCEEKRVAVGATQFGTTNSSHSFGADSVLGANQIIMHDMVGGLSPVLAAGQYAFVLSSADVGGLNDNQAQLTSDYPNLNAVRELYTIPTHPGVQVNLPFPLVDHIGDTFTSEVTHILPQLTLHTSGGTMVEPHVYGRQAAAQVYGSNVAIQEICDDLSGVNAPYPQVRYYARRFGDTTVSLTLTGTGAFTGSTVSITPANFDALVEILDGWREVTLRFVNAPTMGAATGTPGWTWSAVGETAGNRWEVLAASAPAISGIPTNLYNQVPYPNQLGVATYCGSTASVSAPVVAGIGTATGDNNLPIVPALPTIALEPGDFLLVFAATRGAGTVTVSNGYAFVSGITGAAVTDNVQFWGKFVGTTAETNPTVTPVGGVAGDTITAQIIAIRGLPAGSTPANIVIQSVGQLNGSAANIAVPSMTTTRAGLVIAAGWKQDDWTSAATLTVPAGWVEIGDIPATDGNDQGLVWDYLDFPTPGLVNPTQFVITGGVSAISRGIQFLLPYEIGPGSGANLTWMPQGVASPWVTSPTPDPATDAALMFSQDPPTVTGFAISAQTQMVTGFALDCGSLPCCIPTGIAYQRLTWSASTLPVTGFGAYELQRFDQISLEFETIMLATDVTTVFFNDYEARVGLTSAYRIRVLNVLNFAGQWSSQVSGAPPTPGITGGCTDSTGALIFTSNADQTGAHNAAYVMQWEGLPTEAFQLPEADMVTYQPMYGRDGSVAFHGTERGLETFDRTVLLAAAAIDPVRLADAKTIRELAWDDLPYVCVRDDIGDRWFSSVRIPAVSARFNRTNYMARIEIVETTLTPYPVDP